MNKFDVMLIMGISLIMIFMLYFLNTDDEVAKAIVKYDGNIILEIDLTETELREYEVMGANGLIKIEAAEGKVRVVEEISPYNICSKKGWSNGLNDVIICLPNRVVIELVGKDKLDAIIY